MEQIYNIMSSNVVPMEMYSKMMDEKIIRHIAIVTKQIHVLNNETMTTP